jgi:subtilisin family serine protease
MKKDLTGKGLKIGVIDTGIDYNHPDLKEAYKGGYDFVDNDEDLMETTYNDWKNGKYKPEFSMGHSYYTEHGTHVSGIIAGQGTNDSDYATKGVAPDADIYGYRVLGPYGSGTTENSFRNFLRKKSNAASMKKRLAKR